MRISKFEKMIFGLLLLVMIFFGVYKKNSNLRSTDKKAPQTAQEESGVQVTPPMDESDNESLPPSKRFKIHLNAREIEILQKWEAEQENPEVKKLDNKERADLFHVFTHIANIEMNKKNFQTSLNALSVGSDCIYIDVKNILNREDLPSGVNMKEKCSNPAISLDAMATRHPEVFHVFTLRDADLLDNEPYVMTRDRAKKIEEKFKGKVIIFTDRDGYLGLDIQII